MALRAACIHTHTSGAFTLRCIARVCQDSGVSPITGSLPRFLWPHNVVVWVRSSAQGSIQRRGPYRDTTDEGRSTPKNDTSLLRRSRDQHLATSRCTTTTMATNRPTSTTSPPKLTTRDSEPKGRLIATSCASRPNKNNEVRGQMDRQAPTQRRQCDTGSRPDRSTSPSTRRAKTGGDRFDPQECGSASDNTEQDE